MLISIIILIKIIFINLSSQNCIGNAKMNHLLTETFTWIDPDRPWDRPKRPPAVISFKVGCELRGDGTPAE